MLDLVTPSASNRCPAVQRCIDAGRAAHSEARRERQSDFQCTDRLKEAYLQAMPDLSSYENVCDFISCVSHAMINGVLYQSEAKSYLYAAQVALSAVRRPSAKPKPEAA